MKTNNCTVLNKDILKAFKFLTKISSRFFSKFFYTVNNALMKKLNKFWSKTIIPATIA